MTISGRVKSVRLALGLSQADASVKFEIPLGSIRKYESGPSEPGSGALGGMARAGVNTNWLLTGEGDMFLTRPPEASYGKPPKATALTNNEPATGSYVATQEECLIEEPFDGDKEMLEALLRVMEYKFVHKQTNPYLIDVAIDTTKAWTPIATERYPALAIRLKAMETAYLFLKAGLNEANEGSS